MPVKKTWIQSIKRGEFYPFPGLTTKVFIIGLVASNHGNLCNELIALVLGCYGVFHAEVNGTE